MLAGSLAALLVLSTLAAPPTRVMVWNVTPSIPTGLYWIAGPPPPRVGDRVAITPPPVIGRMLAERGYLAPRVPLLKRVAAVAGQQVCRFNRLVTINARPAGIALAQDRAGRPLPAWAGCRRLGPGELFVMNAAQPSSFDGRYFGAIAASAVIGRAVPIWTDERGDGAQVWFVQRRRQESP